MTLAEIYDLVMGAETEHKLGFNPAELKYLLDKTGVSSDAFGENFGTQTCSTNERGESILYRSDVWYAIRTCITGKGPNALEWD